MLNGKTVYALIPARGGSKGIPRKNLYRLGNDTLLERTIKLAKACRYVDSVVVSTDDAEMHELAKKYGVNMPAPRPAHLATDTARTVDVVLHVMEEMSINDAYIFLLQTTSPLRTLADAEGVCGLLEKNTGKADAVASVVRHDSPHPDKIQKIDGGYLKSYLGKESLVARQSLPEVYALNGAFYITHTGVLLRERTFMPEHTLPFVMPKERSVNLDGMMDLYLIEALVTKGIVRIEEYAT
ncbi:MAG: acylneuraminate cytidylyltransferase family protein [Deltaproteobacteria bacterium]|nr:acylneuraminate cytidylyltransferase family protein [Deltaproteobacteria bacterium]